MSGLIMPRDPRFEAEMTALAAQAVGLPAGVAEAIRAYSDARALPGPLMLDGRDWEEELRQELGDAANYAVWGIQGTYDRVLRGDSDACAHYERIMRTLTRVAQAWRELHTVAT